MTTPQTKRWKILRRCLIGFAVLLTLIATFYTEENWRGKRAWENCKRELEAKGVKMDWAAYIPPPVPDDKNVFAVPEMQKWFVGRGGTELSKRIGDIVNSNLSNLPPTRLVVAEVTIGMPGAVPPTGVAVLSYGDPQARMEMSRLVNEAVGPSFIDPIGLTHILQSPEEILPAKIFLQCQTAPTPKELEHFLPSPIISEWRAPTENEKAQVEFSGNDSYRVTMPSPSTVADFLAWNAALVPEFTLIRQALQRPYTRINGDYQNPDEMEIPIPNFVTIRAFVQRLGALAQCHLLQGEPEEALRDLTLLHDLCRILECRPSGKPMTLVAAMTHVAVAGLYTSVIADGLAWHAWREPQLVALQAQLQEINLLPDVRRAFEEDAACMCRAFQTAASPQFVGWLGVRVPKGLIYQNMVRIANISQTLVDSMDSSGQMVFPKKVDAAAAIAKAVSAHPSPYTCLAAMAIPNIGRAALTTARNQTLVREALIACALERFRLAHNSYPEKLDALAPQFLAQIPPDLIGGQPLHYRRAADDKFVLYSVGWNEKDDGGKPGSDDDWVWDDTGR